MPAPAYTRRLLLLSQQTGTHYSDVVPAGETWILRDIELFQNVVPPYPEVYVAIDGAANILHLRSEDWDTTCRQWEGRVALKEGERVVVYFGKPTDIIITGYVLQAG
jgi:hypothetical protein